MPALICLIEDDLTHAFIFDYSFNNSNTHTIVSYQSAEDALRLLIANNLSPDIFILDHNLPGMTGLDALSEIKWKYPQALVYVMSAGMDRKTIATYFKQGITDYFEKSPEGLEELSAVIGMDQE